jgi:uncharacterized NAD-dependent epimerase/dehydratase family protein
MIICYEAGRPHVGGMPHVPLTPLPRLIEAYESMARLMGPSRVIGVAINGRRLSDDAAAAERERVQKDLGLPACDVIRDGADVLLQAILELQRTR